MSISLEIENKIEEMVKQVRKTVKVGSPIVIVITANKTIINPDMPKTNKNYSYAYGLGFQDGRNDLYNEINRPLFKKNTKKANEYQ